MQLVRAEQGSVVRFVHGFVHANSLPWSLGLQNTDRRDVDERTREKVVRLYGVRCTVVTTNMGRESVASRGETR